MKPFTLPADTVIDLSDRAVFSIAGPDARRYLNGQISQDVNAASTSQALYTGITNAKGKLQGDGFVRAAGEDTFWLDCPAELRESMLQRIDMYLIADDAELTDISDSTTLYHVIGEDAPYGCWACNRFGIAGYDTTVCPEGSAASVEDIERVRITHQVPLWGAELDDSTLPPEAKMERSAISYTKGCYIGQEVISRMKSSGKVNRILTSFTLSHSATLPLEIPNPDKPDGKPAGVITSQCQHDGQTVALGFLHRKYLDHPQFTVGSIEVNTLHSHTSE